MRSIVEERRQKTDQLLLTSRASIAGIVWGKYLALVKMCIRDSAGIVKVRKEGTKNYYYFAPEMEAFEQLVSTLHLAMKISKKRCV